MNCVTFYQLLPTTSLGNEKGQQMRIQMLILWFKGLKNVANRANVKKKVGLARRVTRLAARSPFCDGRVTFLADPTFLHINT